MIHYWVVSLKTRSLHMYVEKNIYGVLWLSEFRWVFVITRSAFFFFAGHKLPYCFEVYRVEIPKTRLLYK